MNKEEKYSDKGDASHYNNKRISEMILIERTYGTYETMIFCEITALKYRLRAGNKKTQPLEQEIIKANWYENAAAFYLDKIKIDENVVESLDKKEYPLPWKEIKNQSNE